MHQADVQLVPLPHSEQSLDICTALINRRKFHIQLNVTKSGSLKIQCSQSKGIRLHATAHLFQLTKTDNKGQNDVNMSVGIYINYFLLQHIFNTLIVIHSTLQK